MSGRSGLRAWYLLVNGLEKFPLVLPDSGMVHLPHQFGVLIDEPRLPENICSCVFHLKCKNKETFGQKCREVKYL